MFSGSIAAILPELDLWIVLAVWPQYCQKGLLRQNCQKLICMQNPVLPQYCGSIARICCSNVAALLLQYTARSLNCILVRVIGSVLYCSILALISDFLSVNYANVKRFLAVKLIVCIPVKYYFPLIIILYRRKCINLSLLYVSGEVMYFSQGK